MMQKQFTDKTSKAAKRAFISAVVFLIYALFLSLIAVFLIVTGGLHCDRQDYGGCALQNMFVDLFGFILTLLFGLIIPFCLVLANVILIIVGWKKEDGGKNLLIASVAMDILALGMVFVFAVSAMFLLGMLK